MGKPFASISGYLTLLLVLTLPFSTALNSVLLVLMAFWVVYLFVTQVDFYTVLKSNLSTIAWLMIPFFYGISVFYSKEFTRAVSQWLILAPAVILPVLFAIQPPKTQLENCYKGLAVSILMVGLVHILVARGFISWPGKDPVITSVFHNTEQHSFIIWSAILLSTWTNASGKFWKWVVPLLFLNLFYYGHIGLIALSIFTFLVMYWTRFRRDNGLLIPRILIFGTFLLTLALVYFNVFRLRLSDALYNVVALYTNEDWTASMKGMLADFRFSALQWLKHPFTGVGIGDHVDAIWNEYHDHGMEAPEGPVSQWMHFLVSAGIGAFFSACVLIGSWMKLNRRKLVYLILASSVLLLTAPFKSQVSISAFMIAVLMLPPDHE